MFNDLEDRKKYFVNNTLPTFIYVLPVNFDYEENASIIFDEESEKNRQLVISNFFNYISNAYSIIINNISFFNDLIHLDYEGHKKIAFKVKELLENVKQEDGIMQTSETVKN